MTELDFEELDKAVNDLMQEGGAVPVAQSDRQEPRQESEQPDTGDAQATDSSAPAVTPLAVKRRGRFMDVMAPTGANKPVLDGVIAKRQGVTIAMPGAQPENSAQTDDERHDDEQPMDAATNTEPVGDQNVSDDGGDTGQRPDASGPDTDGSAQNGGGDYAANPAPAHEWPEAKEVASLGQASLGEQQGSDQSDDADNNHSEQTTEQGEISQEQSGQDNKDTHAEVVDHADDEIESTNDEQLTTVVTPDETQDNAEKATEPAAELPESVMTSPFLPDTKVEKRPLGGNDTTGQSATDQAAVSTPDMPREYGSDLMNLEADNNVTPEKHDEPVSQASVPVAQDSPAQPSAPGATVQVVAAATAGAIFDTDTNHTPLQQPVKTKNGWLVVIWVLVLLIIGAIAGALYYYFTMH